MYIWELTTCACTIEYESGEDPDGELNYLRFLTVCEDHGKIENFEDRINQARKDNNRIGNEWRKRDLPLIIARAEQEAAEKLKHIDDLRAELESYNFEAQDDSL